jgi:PAS domain S-box-containing protein
MPQRPVVNERRKVRDEAERRLRDPISVPRASANAWHELQVHQIELEMQNDELRRCQVALEEARDLYSEVFHFAPIGYLILTESGLIQDANLTAAAMLGVERNKALGGPFVAFLGQGEAGRWHQLFPTLIGRGEWTSLRMALQRRDGSRLHARLSCEGQGTRDGSPVVRVALADIGDLVRAEQALQDRDGWLTEVLDEFQDGYWDWSADGMRSVLSRQARRILGISVDAPEILQPLAYDWRSGIQADDLPVVESTVSDVLEGRRSTFEIDARWNHSPSNWRWIRVRGRVATRDGNGRVLRIRGTISDVSEFKSLQQAHLLSEGRGYLLEAMVRNHPGGAIGIFDRDLHFLTVDGRPDARFGGCDRSLVEFLVLESYLPEHREKVQGAFRAALAGKTAEVESVFEGQVVEVRTGPVMDSTGRIVMGVVTVQIPPKSRRGSPTVPARRGPPGS